MESPLTTFHAIAIARHKNYMLFLSSLFGFALIFFLFFAVKAAEYTDSLLNILIAGIVVGPILGLISVLTFALFAKIAGAIINAKASFKQIIAVTAYGLVPIIISFVVILPIEIMTFGLYLFSKNPSPYTLKPVSFLLLGGIDILFTLWSFILLIIGLRMVFSTSWMKSIMILLISCCLLIAMYWDVLAKFFPQSV